MDIPSDSVKISKLSFSSLIQSRSVTRAMLLLFNEKCIQFGVKVVKRARFEVIRQSFLFYYQVIRMNSMCKNISKHPNDMDNANSAINSNTQISYNGSEYTNSSIHIVRLSIFITILFHTEWNLAS